MRGFGLSQRTSFGVSGWHTEAPTLYVTPGHLSDDRSDIVKRVRLTRKDTSRCIIFSFSGSRALNAEEMEKIALPFLQRKVGRASQSFSSRWGWVRFCTGDAWNLPSEGTGVVGCRLVSPAEGTGALALARFRSVARSSRVWTDTRAVHTVRTTTTTPPSHHHHTTTPPWHFAQGRVALCREDTVFCANPSG